MKKLLQRLEIPPVTQRNVEWMRLEQQRRTRLRRVGQIKRATKKGGGNDKKS